MSIKSLLQLILVLLIFLIIGGIYFLYFYTGPLKNQTSAIKELDEFKAEKNIQEYSDDQEILEDIIISEKDVVDNKNKKTNKDDQYISFNKENILDKKKDKSKNKQIIKEAHLKNDKNQIENLTKEIEYITSNQEGDIFKIIAQYGKTNIENSNILDLEKVDGIISSTKRSQIYITSDYAEYNYDNQNSKFYNNVEIKYDDKVITCDNLDLLMNKNYAIAYNNVKIIDEKSVMKAQIVTLNILTKDIDINSQDKVKILTN